MSRYVSLAAAAAVCIGLSVNITTAEAVTVNDYELVFTGDGAPPPGVNDCSGDLGTPPDCTWDGSPMIYKFDFNNDGSIQTETGGAFAQVDGSEFTFDFSDGFKWIYDPDANDPGITAFSVKGGDTYNVWQKLGTAFVGVGDFSDNWFPPNGAGLSHIVFYDSLTPIPVPAGLVLFLSGLAGIGFLGRYKAKRREPAAI